MRRSGPLGFSLLLVVAAGASCQSTCLKRFSGAGDASTAPVTQWGKITHGIGRDGAVPLDVALQAFAAVVAPLPGVTSPAADKSDKSLPWCGTLPTLWVASHAKELTPAQHAAWIGALAKKRAKLDVKHEIAWDTTASGGAPTRVLTDDMTWASQQVERYLGPVGWVQVALVDPRDVPSGRMAQTVAIKGPHDSWTPSDATDPTNTGECNIKLTANFGDASVYSQFERRYVLVHELTHCYQHMQFGGTLHDMARSGGWVLEGFAEWVAWHLVGNDPSEWTAMIGGSDGMPGALSIHTDPYPGGLSIFLRLQRAGFAEDTIKALGPSLLEATSPTDSVARVERLRPGVLQDWTSESTNRSQLGAAWTVRDAPGPAAALFRAPKQEPPLTNGATIAVDAPAGVQQLAEIAFDPAVRSVHVVATGSGRGVFGQIGAGGAVDVHAGSTLDWAGPFDTRLCLGGGAGCSGRTVAGDKGLLLALSGGASGTSVTLQAGDQDAGVDPPPDRCLVGTWKLDDSTAIADAQHWVGNALHVTSMRVDMTLAIGAGGDMHEHVVESTLVGTSPDGSTTVRTSAHGDVDGTMTVNAAAHTLLMHRTRDATTTDVSMKIGNQPWRAMPSAGGGPGGGGWSAVGNSPAPFTCSGAALTITPPEMHGVTMRFRKLP